MRPRRHAPWQRRRIIGDALLSTQREGEAKVEFTRALAIARQQQAKSWELRAAMSMARERDRRDGPSEPDAREPEGAWRRVVWTPLSDASGKAPSVDDHVAIRPLRAPSFVCDLACGMSIVCKRSARRKPCRWLSAYFVALHGGGNARPPLGKVWRARRNPAGANGF